MKDPVKVQFTKQQPPYHPGESVLRSEKDAFKLVSLGVAKYLEPPPGLDEFGKALEEKAALKQKPTTPKPNVKVEAEPKGGAKAKS
jgi:hypothetical protein